MKISVVTPVHNEEQYLRYSLPALKRLAVDEYVFVLDRCTDGSFNLIIRAMKRATIILKKRQCWRNGCAEAFQMGFDEAKGDVILASGADLIIDPKIPRLIRSLFRDSRLGTVCFRYLNYDLFSLKGRIHGFYENLYKTVIQQFRREARHTGFYAFRKEMMREIGGLHDVPSEYDEFCRRVKNSRWRLIYVPYTRTLHLRPGLSKEKQYTQGMARVHLPQYNLAKTVFHAFVHLKPYMLVGYLHESARSRIWQTQTAQRKHRSRY